MVYDRLIKIQQKKHSLLCIGLDPDPSRLPPIFEKNESGVLKFCKTIIDSTHQFACAFKINFAFFEQFGPNGFRLIDEVLKSIPDDVITIADAKRGDIGNSSKAYARGIFESFSFDCVTLSPFMGTDSLEPFFDYKEKLCFVLLLTSNPGRFDFQTLSTNEGKIYEIVAEKFTQKFNYKQLGFVVGATDLQGFQQIRSKIPQNFILSPGIGVQGGNADNLLNINKGKPLIVNVSRDISYPKDFHKFELAVFEQAKKYWQLLKFGNES